MRAGRGPQAAGVLGAPTSRGRATALLGAVAGLAGAVWDYPVLVGLGAVLVGLVLLETVAVLVPDRLAVHRTVAPRVVVRHDPCWGRLELRGPLRRGLVRLEVADLVDGTPVPVALPVVRRRGDRSPAIADHPVPTRRRGLLEVGPVLLHRRGLTGMAERSSAAGDVVGVRVLPRRIPVGGLPPGRRRSASGSEESLELGGTDLVGLHEYAAGDDLRRLHWASSARTGTLMVREDAEPSEPGLLVLLDDRAAAWGPGARPQREERFEEAVELVAALTRAAVDAGRPVTWRTTSGRHEVVVPAARTGTAPLEARELDLLLAEIALLEEAGAAGADAHPARHTGRHPGQHPVRDLDVVVVVTGPDGDLEDAARLAAGASTAVAAVVDAAPVVGVAQVGPLLVLRGASSTALAASWDVVVAR